jgi:hypothetical protein
MRHGWMTIDRRTLQNPLQFKASASLAVILRICPGTSAPRNRANDSHHSSGCRRRLLLNK